MLFAVCALLLPTIEPAVASGPLATSDLPWHREAGLYRLCVALAVVILVGAGASRVLKALSAYA